MHVTNNFLPKDLAPIWGLSSKNVLLRLFIEMTQGNRESRRIAIKCHLSFGVRIMKQNN